MMAGGDTAICGKQLELCNLNTDRALSVKRVVTVLDEVPRFTPENWLV
jgi:hypothetical protein